MITNLMLLFVVSIYVALIIAAYRDKRKRLLERNRDRTKSKKKSHLKVIK